MYSIIIYIIYHILYNIYHIFMICKNIEKFFLRLNSTICLKIEAFAMIF